MKALYKKNQIDCSAMQGLSFFVFIIIIYRFVRNFRIVVKTCYKLPWITMFSVVTNKLSDFFIFSQPLCVGGLMACANNISLFIDVLKLLFNIVFLYNFDYFILKYHIFSTIKVKHGRSFNKSYVHTEWWKVTYLGLYLNYKTHIHHVSQRADVYLSSRRTHARTVDSRTRFIV